MAEIRVSGKAGGTAGGPPKTTSQLDAQRIEISAREAAKMEMGLQRMVRAFEQQRASTAMDKFTRDFTKFTRELQSAANQFSGGLGKGMAAGQAKIIQEERTLAKEKQKSDNDWLRKYNSVITAGARYNNKLERETAVERKRDEKSKLTEARNAEREEAKRRKEEDRRRRQEQRDEENRKRNVTRRAYQGAVIGGLTATALSRGDIAGVAGVLGGEFGAIGGEMLGGPGGAIAGGILGDLIGRFGLNPAGPIYKAANEASEVTQGAFNLARTGRDLSGNTLLKSMNFMSTKPPAWYKMLNTSSPEVIDSLTSLGISIPPEKQEVMAQLMSVMSRSPALRGLPNDAIPGLLKQGIGTGAAGSGPNASLSYMRPFAELLAEANLKHWDRSKLLTAMASSLDTIVKSGAAALNVPEVGNLYMRLAAGGTPGGQSGDVPSQMIEANTKTFSDITKNPFTMTMTQMLMGKFNYFKTGKDVQNFAGIANPTDAQWKVIHQVVGEARAGMTPQAAIDAATLLRSNPNRWGELINSPDVFKGMSPQMKRFMTARIMSTSTGLDYGAALDNSMSPSPESPRAAVAATNSFISNARYAVAMKSGQVPVFRTDGNFTEADYTSILLAEGVPPALAAIFAKEGVAGKIQPQLLAALALKESRMDPKQGWNKSHVAFGIMQINKNHIGEKGYEGAFSGDVTANVHAAVTDLNRKFSASRGNAGRAIANYGEGTQKELDKTMFQYNKLSGGIGGAGGTEGALGLPTDMFSLASNAKQGDFFASAIALKSIGPAANSAVEGLNRFASAIKKFVDDSKASYPSWERQREQERKHTIFYHAPPGP